jgi:aspartate kinase
LTAVALAAALGARACEIYTDVEGVFTADPRLVPTARKIRTLGYDEMLELAGAGAQVMLPRAVEVAKRFGVAICVKCSFNNEEGTWIMKQDRNAAGAEQAVVSGVALDRHLTKITIAGVPDHPGIAAAIFGELASGSVPVDAIVQSAAKSDKTNDISITVSRGHSKTALAAMNRAARKIGGKKVSADDACAKVSVVGVGIKNASAIPATIFQTLAAKKINIQMISTSEIKISCVISERQAQDALRALHDAFGLGKTAHPAVRRTS